VQKRFSVSLKLLAVFGLVYLFLVSIGLMGDAFKGFGKGFAEALIQTTSNPFIGLFIGILATSLVQSSSTTTSIVVGMVAGDALTISNAIPIIMGANIGTTVTNLLVSLGHFHRKEEFKRAFSGASLHDFFNQLCVLVLFPLEIFTHFLEKTAIWLSGVFSDVGGFKFTSPVKTATKPVVHWFHDLFSEVFHFADRLTYISMLVLSVVILFFCLFYIVKIMRTVVASSAESAIDKAIEGNAGIALFVGILFTVLVQSSSITTSLCVPLVAGGILTLEGVFPITLGANIGTTSTAILASFATGNIAAITIAFVHFLFNVIGALVLYPIKAVRQIPIRMARFMGEMAYKKRRYAVIYVLTVFFVLPIALITLSKMFLK